MLFKLFGIVVTIIVGAIIGLRLSKDIDSSVLYTLFWILYVVTYLTFANIIAVSLFYDTLRTKAGPPGPRGPIGESGDVGEQGVCTEGCQQLECADRLNNAFIKKINELAGNPEPPIRFVNYYMRDKLKRICTSKQFEKSSEIKGADSVINYIIGIIEEWAKIIYEAGGKEFIESPGTEQDYNWKDGKKPFEEIEKYDIYYWKMNKLFKPIGLDVCDDPEVNKNLPQEDRPRLFMVETNVYDRTSKRGGYTTYRARNIHNSKIGLDMFPLGDVGFKGHDDSRRNGKVIDGIDAPDDVGPNRRTVLVAGEVKQPAYFKARGRFFEAKAPPGYKCLGDTAVNDTTKYRCVPEECVEKVSTNTYNGQHIYSDGRYNFGSMWGMHGADVKYNDNKASKSNHNLFRVTAGLEGHHQPFYKIRDICLTGTPPPNKKHQKGEWVSNQWHGYPEKNPGYTTKYSIFNYLGIVPEGVIHNYGTKNKFYFITTGKNPNEYFIKYYAAARGRRGNFEVAGNNDVNVNLHTNRDKKEQLWSLEYTDPRFVHIKSKQTGKYLGLHYKDGHKLIAKQYNNNQKNHKHVKWRIISTSTGERHSDLPKK